MGSKANIESSVTISAVAKAAGVSVGTVSHVLNHPDRVLPATRENVERAIADLGYIPSEAGKRLRRGESRLVGVLILDFTNPFFAQAISGIELALQERDFLPMIMSSGGDSAKELRLIKQLAGLRVHGLIITPTDSTLDNLEEVNSFRGRVVFMDHPPAPGCPATVSSDDVTGARYAINHLVELGHQQIGFINGPERIRQSRDRRRGVQGVAKESPDIQIYERQAKGFKVSDGVYATEILLREAPQITGLFCASDQLAIGALRAISEAGFKVPEDISLVGYDDIDIAANLAPALTTIRQPMHLIGRKSVDLLFEPAANDKHIVYKPELILRASTRELNEN